MSQVIEFKRLKIDAEIQQHRFYLLFEALWMLWTYYHFNSLYHFILAAFQVQNKQALLRLWRLEFLLVTDWNSKSGETDYPNISINSDPYSFQV